MDKNSVSFSFILMSKQSNQKSVDASFIKLNDMIAVVARLSAQKEHIENVKAALQAVVEPTRAQDGCLLYELYQDVNQPETFVFYENWDTKAHLETHRLSAPMVDLGHQIKDKLDQHLEANTLQQI